MNSQEWVNINAKIEIQNFRTELQNKINEVKLCFICGRNDFLTEHHVIPQRIKSPLLNFKIPICDNCRKVVHNGDELIAILRKIYLKAYD